MTPPEAIQAAELAADASPTRAPALPRPGRQTPGHNQKRRPDDPPPHDPGGNRTG
jgi:hypothetical protein